MKNKNIMVLVAVVLMLSTATLAKNADNPGRRMGQYKNITGVNDSDEPEVEHFRGSVGIADETRGVLMSEISHVRKEQFKLMKDDMNHMGYHGSVSDFSVAFNRQLKGLRAQIRVRLNTFEDSELSRAVMRETATRELARIREERLAALDITDDETLDALQYLSQMREDFAGEIRNMNQQFRAAVNEIAHDGTVEEKRELKGQIRTLLQNRKAKIKVFREDIRQQRKLIRELLKQNRTAEEILEGITAP